MCVSKSCATLATVSWIIRLDALKSLTTARQKGEGYSPVFFYSPLLVIRNLRSISNVNTLDCLKYISRSLNILCILKIPCRLNISWIAKVYAIFEASAGEPYSVWPFTEKWRFTKCWGDEESWGFTKYRGYVEQIWGNRECWRCWDFWGFWHFSATKWWCTVSEIVIGNVCVCVVDLKRWWVEQKRGVVVCCFHSFTQCANSKECRAGVGRIPDIIYSRHKEQTVRPASGAG